ncbi:MAG: hypothetical protein ACI4M5_04515 [Christensenellales bacterium]
MKKKILIFILAICMLIPCSIYMSACEDTAKVYAWGKTFTYQGAYSTNYDHNSNDAPTYKTLLQREFEADNLDFENATMSSLYDDNIIKTNLSPGASIGFDAFISFLNHEALMQFTSKYKDWKVEVGNREDNSITINEKTYLLSQEDDEWNFFDDDEYGIINDNISEEKPARYLGRIDLALPKSINDCNSDYKCLLMDFEEVKNLIITIPTKTVVNEDGYFVEENWDEVTQTYVPTYSALVITFTPYFSIAE